MSPIRRLKRSAAKRMNVILTGMKKPKKKPAQQQEKLQDFAVNNILLIDSRFFDFFG